MLRPTLGASWRLYEAERPCVLEGWVIFPHGRRWLQGVRTCNEDSCGPDPGSRRPYTHHTWACTRSRHASYPPTARALHHAPHQDPSIHPPVPTLRPVSRSLAHVRPGVATDGIHLTRRSPTATHSRAKRPWTLSPSSCSRPVRMREGRGGCGVHGSTQSRWSGGRRELSRGSHVGAWGPGAVVRSVRTHPRRALCRSTSTSWTCARNRR